MKKLFNKLNPFGWVKKDGWAELFFPATLCSPLLLTDLITSKHPFYWLDVPYILLTVFYGYKTFSKSDSK